MKHIKKEILHALTDNYFQKQKYYPDRKSLLPVDTMDVTGCTIEQAWIWASTYCNLYSWYSSNRAAGNITMSFKEYLAKMLTTKIVNPKTGKEEYCSTEEGYINLRKELISPVVMGYDFKPEFYEAPGINVKDLLDNPLKYLNPENFYQMKMAATKGGTHFVTCYVDLKEGLMGDDTSYRGVPFSFKKYINEKNFIWLMKIPNITKGV